MDRHGKRGRRGDHGEPRRYGPPGRRARRSGAAAVPGRRRPRPRGPAAGPGRPAGVGRGRAPRTPWPGTCGTSGASASPPVCSRASRSPSRSPGPRPARHGGDRVVRPGLGIRPARGRRGLQGLRPLLRPVLGLDAGHLRRPRAARRAERGPAGVGGRRPAGPGPAAPRPADVPLEPAEVERQLALIAVWSTPCGPGRVRDGRLAGRVQRRHPPTPRQGRFGRRRAPLRRRPRSVRPCNPPR